MKTLSKRRKKKEERKKLRNCGSFVNDAFLTYLFFFIFLFSFFFFISCSTKDKISNQSENQITFDTVLWEEAQEIASSMDDKLLAAQVIITGIDGMGSLPPDNQAMLKEIPAGGIMLFRYNVETNNDSIKSLILETTNLIAECSGIAPFICVDLEGGTVNRFRRLTELPMSGLLPDALKYWELAQLYGEQTAYDKIYDDAVNAAREIAALGVSMNFAPVAEIENDYNREFLDGRSYGPDTEFTTNAALLFIRAMQSAGVTCVIKHFPGSAGVDPHFSASILDVNKKEFDKLVLPFKKIISTGHSAVMVSHTIVPVIDKDKIASLSSVFMNDILRKEFEFNGIIIADDFVMAAAGDIPPELAAVNSIAAGADMILVWPKQLKITHNAVMEALDTGSLPRERLQEAVARIIYLKTVRGFTQIYADLH